MSITRGIQISGVIRSTGQNQKGNPFVQVEVPSRMGGVELLKIGTKSNGQKLNEEMTFRVSPNVFDGKFYGFSEL